MFQPRGTPEQEQLRALCGYLGAPMGARLTSEVEREALPFVQAVPTDALTLEIILLSKRIGLIDEMERHHGLEIYKLDTPEDHRLWNVMYRAALPPEIEARLGRGVIAMNFPTMNDMARAQLGRKAALHEHRELFRAIVTSDISSDEDCALMIADPQLIDSSAFAACAEEIAERISRAELTTNQRMHLTQRLHDNTDIKGLALLAKTGHAIALEREYTTSRMSALAQRLLGCLSSNHGRMHLMQSLPALEEIIRAPRGVSNPIVEAALPPL